MSNNNGFNSFKEKHPFLVNGLLIAIAFVLVGYIALLFIDVFTSHGQERRVPDVRNMPLEKAIDILERQIVKCKTKLARGRHQTITADDAESAIEVEEEPDNYPIVRVKTYEMKPLTVQDAILHMNMVGHSFYMFKNRENGKICTVYKRNDGDYGLIEAED